MKKFFPFYKQHDQMDCGASCLRMIFKYYGKSVSIQKIRKLCQVTKSGVNMLGISQAAETMGFRTYGVRLGLEQLNEIKLPCILHWNQNHFVVLYKTRKDRYYVADPGAGLISFDRKEFSKNWFSKKQLHEGLSVLLEPTPDFYEEEEVDRSLKWSKIFTYFFKYKRLFIESFALNEKNLATTK